MWLPKEIIHCFMGYGMTIDTHSIITGILFPWPWKCITRTMYCYKLILSRYIWVSLMWSFNGNKFCFNTMNRYVNALMWLPKEIIHCFMGFVMTIETHSIFKCILCPLKLTCRKEVTVPNFISHVYIIYSHYTHNDVRRTLTVWCFIPFVHHRATWGLFPTVLSCTVIRCYLKCWRDIVNIYASRSPPYWWINPAL